MKFTWFLVLTATVWAAPEAEAEPTGAELNWQMLENAIHSMTAISFPSPAPNLDNIAAPPRSLLGEIVNNVPPTALMQLAIPSQRKALASSFKAGHTPDWYQSLPTGVKSYISVVKSQLAAGALTAAPVSETPTPVTVTTTGDTAAATTSSEGGAAKPTGGGVVMSGLGAMGVLGIVLVL
ncbi:hypothetical protein FE257_002855 [Aspergillus nanangensis]|uniref:Uncharacterized protein n=1 Tax=Aspergillus nanangensis TaxID=2582783 RepID=A0AAD4CSX3_ASPNN|nr:hypothetical protein FE257_002855 [Aspergillus nanangensis]